MGLKVHAIKTMTGQWGVAGFESVEGRYVTPICDTPEGFATALDQLYLSDAEYDDCQFTARRVWEDPARATESIDLPVCFADDGVSVLARAIAAAQRKQDPMSLSPAEASALASTLLWIKESHPQFFYGEDAEAGTCPLLPPARSV